MATRPALLASPLLTLALGGALALAGGCGPAEEAAVDEAVDSSASALLGPNLLQNACFGTIGPAGNPVTKITAVPGVAGPSAAAFWTMYSTNPCYLSTEVVPSTRRRGGRMLHIVTRGSRNGVVQRFNPAGDQAFSSAWFYVRMGRAALGTGNGINNLDHLTTTTNAWERVSGMNGTAPVQSVALFSASSEGADFYVDCPSVQAGTP